MKRLVDFDTYVRSCRLKHGYKFIYDRASYYAPENNKSLIYCRDCGTEFWCIASSHKHRSGCPKCDSLNKSKRLNHGKKGFVQRAVDRHGKLYDYSSVEYIHSKRKVSIKCNRCEQVFEMTPMKHLQGQGCRSCNSKSVNKINTEDALHRLHQSGRGRFSFFMEDYTSFNNREAQIRIFCKKHRRMFYKVPAQFVKTPSCDICSSINYRNRGFYGDSGSPCLYLMRFTSYNESFYKIGVSVDPYGRRRAIRQQCDYKIDILCYLKLDDKDKALEIEEYLLENCERYYPFHFFNGRTECVTKSGANTALKYLKGLDHSGYQRVPFYKQRSRTSTGITGISWISDASGYKVSFNVDKSVGFRAWYPVSRYGTKDSALIAAMEAAHLYKKMRLHGHLEFSNIEDRYTRDKLEYYYTKRNNNVSS